jgi:CTP synthase (UTP-ammonia lyase)
VRSPRIAVVGDYDERKETHQATNAELAVGGVDFVWVPTAAVGKPSLSLGEFDGLLISPGSPYAEMDGALAAIRQHVVLEMARNVLGIEDGDHAETKPSRR